MGSPREYEAIARRVQQLSGTISGLGRGMGGLQNAVTDIIGSTATGEDRAMVGLLASASSDLRTADQALQEAVAAAHAAAREAAEEEARKKRGVSRR